MTNVVKEYKVAYWDNGKLLQSRMFDDLLSATNFVDTLSPKYLSTIMQLESKNNGDYTWKILPYSVGKLIPLSTTLYQYKFPIITLICLSYLLKK